MGFWALPAKFKKGEEMAKDEMMQLRALATEVQQDTFKSLDVAVLALANAGNEVLWEAIEDFEQIAIIDEGARGRGVSVRNVLANLKGKAHHRCR